MPRKKRKRAERPTIHPRNRYSDSPPDFALLASLYPSFEPFVFYSRDGRPRIDWTDFNATRELTRILLLHDHGLNWWIPDGQLCPTVPNRSNYIHWVEDLLSSEIITKGDDSTGHIVKGFDIGTGANCIYPLLGASLLGWNFVGSDVTDVALEWAERNVKSNPHISELIEIRKVESNEPKPLRGEELNDQLVDEESTTVPNGIRYEENKDVPSSTIDVNLGENKNYCGPPVLLGVVKDGETFDFCMCNPPFFESMVEVGMNPKTSCGGTPEEMVCPGGEHAFVTRIIEDSSVLKQSFRWYTSMLGKKANLKNLISKLWEVGVTIVKTTEFVQGQTCRWGLAWSFVPPAKKIMSPPVVEKNVLTFMLEGLPRQFSALHVLQEVESFFISKGASCKSNASLFTVDVRLSIENQLQEMLSCAGPSIELYFRISVFQQIPCTLLVKGSLQHKQNPVQGAFSSSLQQLEEVLKSKFCR